jgi:hypothetical protein
MDADNVLASSTYCQVSAFRYLYLVKNGATEATRAFNTALAEFASADPARLIVSCPLPIHDIDAAVAEVPRREPTAANLSNYRRSRASAVTFLSASWLSSPGQSAVRPELGPRRQLVRQRADPGVVGRPIGRRLVERPLGHFDTPPQPVQSSPVLPGAVDDGVSVVVADELLHHCPIEVGDGAAVDDAARKVVRSTVVRVEGDQVVRYRHDRQAGSSHRRVELVAERSAPNSVRCTDVGNEQPDDAFEVTAVHRDRVFDRQLLDAMDVIEPAEDVVRVHAQLSRRNRGSSPIASLLNSTGAGVRCTIALPRGSGRAAA